MIIYIKSWLKKQIFFQHIRFIADHAYERKKRKKKKKKKRRKTLKNTPNNPNSLRGITNTFAVLNCSELTDT